MLKFFESPNCRIRIQNSLLHFAVFMFYVDVYALMDFKCMVDIPRLQPATDSSLSTNHCGVMIVSVPGVRPSVVDLGVDSSLSYSVLGSRQGRSAVSSLLFTVLALKLSETLDHVVRFTLWVT